MALVAWVPDLNSPRSSVEGSISARTEKAQNSRCEAGFGLQRGKAEEEKGERRCQGKTKCMAGLVHCV